MSNLLEMDSLLVNEVCYIYNRRNSINKVRTSLRRKLHYWITSKNTSGLYRSEVKMNRLKLRGELLCIRAETMRFTKESSVRLKQLRELLGGFKPLYNNGYVDCIFFKDGLSVNNRSLIKSRADMFAMDVCLEDLLTEKGA